MGRARVGPDDAHLRLDGDAAVTQQAGEHDLRVGVPGRGVEATDVELERRRAASARMAEAEADGDQLVGRHEPESEELVERLLMADALATLPEVRPAAPSTGTA